MVVDDERLICWTLEKTFSKDGYEVICCNSGEQALAWLQEDPVHVMILDLRLPGMSGLEVLDEVRKSYPETKVLMISAWGTQEVRQRAEELGVLGFFDKPLNLSSIKQTISKVFQSLEGSV